LKDSDDILGAEGPLARSLPGFAPRAEQLEMARCVGQALAALEPLVVEAGTGTGKTFAYLVPALLSGRHVIISTGTRTLQDQLYHRDLPAVSAALGRPVKIALLKGRANYLCRHRLGLARSNQELPLHDNGAAHALARVAQWAQRTRNGDISELTGIAENHPVWPAVTSTRDNCLGTSCSQFNDCHVFAARRAAQAADIVIVNHHLLLADLALKEGGFGDLLPGTEAVILDEAHQVPEIAAQFFGISLSARQVTSLIRDTRTEFSVTQQGSSALDAALKALEIGVAELRQELPRGDKRIEWGALSSAAVERLEQIETQLQVLHATLSSSADGSAGLEHCAQRAQELRASCADLRMLDEESGVRWIELYAQSWTLQYTPFEIASRLQQFIDGQACAWIFTSATLAVGEDFSHFTQRIGVPEARTVRIDSPFDYRRQALLYLPQGMSDPSDRNHASDVLKAAWPLIEAAGGRTFLLFTSHRALAEGAAWMRNRMSTGVPFPVLIQGEAPREQLLRQFRELGNAVLLGTGSFWEGVDVKGQALSLVVIDKLPFASPDDPVLAARLESIRRHGGKPFSEYQLPQAVLALKQGVGRLIRDSADAGVVMICDPRLMTRSYGRVFIDSLPPMPATSEPREAVAMLERISINNV
jgi:ATP-dependent DNA helicase DinG